MCTYTLRNCFRPPRADHFSFFRYSFSLFPETSQRKFPTSDSALPVLIRVFISFRYAQLLAYRLDPVGDDLQRLEDVPDLLLLG